jgi:hypothetical protein
LAFSSALLQKIRVMSEKKGIYISYYSWSGHQFVFLLLLNKIDFIQVEYHNAMMYQTDI